MAANSLVQTSTVRPVRAKAKPLPTAATSTAPAPVRGQSLTRLMVPRRIDVIKDHQTPDSFLRMEIDDATIYMVPIGPKLVSALIQGLERTQRIVVPTTSSKQ